MSIAYLAQEVVETKSRGYGAIGYGLAAIGPRHRRGHRCGQGNRRHGPPAEMAGQVRTTMFLGIAFTEALALIGLVAGFIF